MGLMDRFKQGMADAQSAAQMAQNLPGGMPTGMPTQQDMDTMNTLVRLNDVGVERPATIVSITPTGRTDPGGGIEHAITVTVTPDAGAPYDATFTQFMHAATMGSWATAGAAVNVRVDPDEPTSMILWGGRQ